jgi:hypothetical protein
MLARQVLANGIRRELARKCLWTQRATGWDWREVGENAGRCTLTSASIDAEVEFGKSRDKAAEKFDISPSTVWRASKVIKKGAPELVKAVAMRAETRCQGQVWNLFHTYRARAGGDEMFHGNIL